MKSSTGRLKGRKLFLSSSSCTFSVKTSILSCGFPCPLSACMLFRKIHWPATQTSSSLMLPTHRMISIGPGNCFHRWKMSGLVHLTWHLLSWSIITSIYPLKFKTRLWLIYDRTESSIWWIMVVRLSPLFNNNCHKNKHCQPQRA